MVSIRLRREGSLNNPYYRIVVTDSRAPRDGKYIEQIGTYDPKLKDKNFKLALDRAEYWISKGAKPSETVASFVRKSRKAAATK
jgi:small subunit ribosomal protein S16